MPILLTFGFRCSDMEDGFNYCLMTSEKYHNTLDRTYYEWLQEASSSHIFEFIWFQKYAQHLSLKAQGIKPQV